LLHERRKGSGRVLRNNSHVAAGTGSQIVCKFVNYGESVASGDEWIQVSEGEGIAGALWFCSLLSPGEGEE